MDSNLFLSITGLGWDHLNFDIMSVSSWGNTFDTLLLVSPTPSNCLNFLRTKKLGLYEQLGIALMYSSLLINGRRFKSYKFHFLLGEMLPFFPACGGIDSSLCSSEKLDKYFEEIISNVDFEEV